MAINAFLKIDGFDGEATLQEFEGQIEVIAHHFLVQRKIGNMSDSRDATGRPTFSPFTITKFMDKSSTMLIKACLNNQTMSEIVLTITKTGDDGAPIKYLTYTLYDVTVVSFEPLDDIDSEVLKETITFSFSNFSMNYIPDTFGSAQGNIEASYDLKAGKVS